MTTTRAALEMARKSLNAAGAAIDAHASKGCMTCKSLVPKIANAIAAINAALKEESNG